MDEFLDGLGCRLRGSGMVADSIMMGIVNSAMEEAFEKACSKEGVLERLNEKSRFCELAVMQLEWCLKFVKEETDSYVVVESIYERERLVSDLTETRDRIQRRLEETEFAISEKDRLLIERFESELKLRQALELKDRELVSLENNLEAEKMKSGGVQEFIHGSMVSIDEGRDGDFCELKNSVDEQFFHIKQKLEDERMNFTNGIRKTSPRKTLPKDINPDLQLVDENGNCSNGNREIGLGEKDWKIDHSLNCCLGPELGFEKMGSDIDILKETLDIAFGMMSNAISLSEVRPMEHQWRWSIEKDTTYIVFNGFAKDVQDFLNTKKGEMLGENWAPFMDDITSLRLELDQLVNKNEEVTRTFMGHDSVTPPSEANFGGKPVPQKINCSRDTNSPQVNDVSSAPDRHGKRQASSSQVFEKDHVEETPKDDSAGQGSLVAEMIRNHESIIRKKSEELNWLKGEIIRENLCSSVKKHNDYYILKKRIHDVILKLDNIIDTNMSITTVGSKCVNESHSINMDFMEELRKWEQEKEDSNLKTAMMEEIYAVVLRSLAAKELNLELHSNDMEDLLTDDVCRTFLKELFKEWNEKIECYIIQNHIREEIFQFIFSELHTEFVKELVKGSDNIIGNQNTDEVYEIVFHEALKYVKWAFDFASSECQKVVFEENSLENSASSNKKFQDLESMTRENMSTIFFSEIIQECNKALENIWMENFIREDIDKTIFNEAIHDFIATEKITRAECQKAAYELTFQNESPSSNMFQTLEGLIKEDVYTVFLKEMIEGWKMEIENNYFGSLIKEEIYHIFIREAVKDIKSCLTESQGKKPQNFEEDLWSANELQSQKVIDKGNLMEKVECLSRYIKVEKDLIFSASSELMEQSRLIELVDLEHVELNKQTIYCKEIFVRTGETLGSLSTKFKMAMDYIAKSEVQLRECTSSFGMIVGEPDKMHNEKTPDDLFEQCTQSSLCLAEKNKDVVANTWSFISTLMEFSKEIEDFESMVHRKIELNVSRLEEVKYQLDLSAEHVTSLRRKELLYKKAFLNRCCNLQKAETEVDLLGDEVDVLVGLLEKLYKALYRHSPVLKNYFGVMDILKLIGKELDWPASRLQQQ